jgi:hypothetical protein
VATFNLGRRSKKSGSIVASKKMAGRPLPKPYVGCGGDEERKHSFQMYGRPFECCVKCGMEHRDVTRWRNLVVNGDGCYPKHPYVEDGIWSGREYYEAMKKGGGTLR